MCVLENALRNCSFCIIGFVLNLLLYRCEIKSILLSLREVRVFAFLLCVISGIEHIYHGRSATHKVWVRRINIGVLNFDQVLDHRICRLKQFLEQLIHNFNYFVPQFGVALEFRNVNFNNHSAQFLKYHLDALERRTLEAPDLLFRKSFKGHLRDKQVGSQGLSIANGCFYVVVRQRVKGIDIQDLGCEQLVEDVVDSRTSHHFHSCVPNKLAFDQVCVAAGVFL